jgi:hypothetical protein
VAEECFRVGLSDIGPIPKFNVMKFMRVIMVGILFYAVNTVVVNRMTRYQNQKILISNNKVMRDLGIDLDIKTRLNDLVKYKGVPFPACLKTELRRSTETLILTTWLIYLKPALI